MPLATQYSTYPVPLATLYQDKPNTNHYYSIALSQYASDQTCGGMFYLGGVQDTDPTVNVDTKIL